MKCTPQKDDELGLTTTGGVTGQLEGIPRVVGELDDFVSLVVVSEDHESVAERRASGHDPQAHLLV